MSTKKALSKGGELTPQQIEALRDIFTTDEINDLWNALHDKASGDRAAVAKVLEGTTLDEVGAGVRSMIDTMNAQVVRAENLANALEACQ